MIKDFGNSKLPRFRAGQALLDQVTAERLNDILSMIEACRLQNGVGYMLNRSAHGTTFTVLDNEHNRPPRLWKLSLDDLNLDPATIISKVIQAVMDEITNAVSDPGQFTDIFLSFLSNIIDAIKSGDAGSASGVKGMIEGAMSPVYQIIDLVDAKVEEIFGKVDPIREALENYFTTRGKYPRSGDMIYTDEIGICYTLYKEVTDEDGTYPTPNLIFRVPFTVGKDESGEGGTKIYAITVFPFPDIAECVKTILRAIINFITALLGSTFEGMTQAIMDAVSQALNALYEMLYELIEQILEMLEQVFQMIEALWNAINSLWNSLGALQEFLNQSLDTLRTDFQNQLNELANELSQLNTEVGEISTKLTDFLAEFRELMSKTTTVNVIDNQGKAATIKVLEKIGPDIDIRKLFNWVDGITGQSYQAKLLFWDTERINGVKPTQVQVCEGGQSKTKTFLEKE